MPHAEPRRAYHVIELRTKQAMEFDLVVLLPARPCLMQYHLELQRSRGPETNTACRMWHPLLGRAEEQGLVQLPTQLPGQLQDRLMPQQLKQLAQAQALRTQAPRQGP